MIAAGSPLADVVAVLICLTVVYLHAWTATSEPRPWRWAHVDDDNQEARQ